MHPSDRHLLGMCRQGDYYLHLALPFGLRSAHAIFNSLADLFHCCLVNNWNVLDLLHYLDDYFTLGPPLSDICASRLKAIDQAATEIGIPLSPDKCVGPTTCLIFLGSELLEEWATKRTCKLKELQSLLGKLNHAVQSCSTVVHFYGACSTF